VLGHGGGLETKGSSVRCCASPCTDGRLSGFGGRTAASESLAKNPFNFVPINSEEQVDCQSHDGIMMPDSRFLARRTLCSLLAFIEWERFETFCGSEEQDQAISATGQSLKTLAGLWEGARCTWVCEHHHVRFAAALALRRRHMSTHTHMAQHPGRLSQGMSCSGSHPSG
jgi:hypothetical protein